LTMVGSNGLRSTSSMVAPWKARRGQALPRPGDSSEKGRGTRKTELRQGTGRKQEIFDMQKKEKTVAGGGKIINKRKASGERL